MKLKRINEQVVEMLKNQKFANMKRILQQVAEIDQTLTEADLDREIARLLQILGEIAWADRVYLFQYFTEPTPCYHYIFEWCKKGVTEQLENCKLVRAVELPYWHERLMTKKSIIVHNLEDIKADMPEEYKWLWPQQIKSLLVVPIYNKKRLWGFLGLDNPDVECIQEFKYLLSSIGGHLGSLKENYRMLRLLDNKRQHLENNLEAMQKDKAVLMALCVDYTTVHYLDLEHDTLETIKEHRVYYSEKVRQDIKIYGNKYSQRLQYLADNFVVEGKSAELMATIGAEGLKKAFATSDRVIYRFKMRPNARGQEYFEAQAINLANNALDTKHRVIIGFRSVDAIVKEELAYQRKLAKTAEEAQQANAAKSLFLSRMSHDIRTPMNAICGLVEIALNNIEDKAKVQDCLLKVQEASKNLQNLANDVLDLAQIEKGELLIRPQNITVEAILDALKPSIQSYLHVHPLNFSLDKRDILHEQLIADPVRLNQVYVNLLSNAFKYTPATGSVRMELYQEELPQADRVRLVAVVHDTGIGMSQEYMKNMYNAFSREVDTRINEVRGSGLGLAIVKRMVELMHGSIEAESELNVGTTFRVAVDLPYIAEDRLSPQRAAELDYAIFQGKHILIAEDNRLSYEIESEVLQMYGISCTHAENGEQCVRLFEAAAPGTFDAILMDMQMPVLNGVEATRKIRWSLHQDAQRIPIIAMTANAFSTDIALCLEAGMDEHLAKPFNAMLLLKVLTRYLQ